MIHIVRGTEGGRFVGAVDGAGRGVDQVLYFVVAAGFEDVEEADYVAVDVGPWVFQGVADAGLGGEVDDGVEGVFFEEGVYGSGVFEVCFDELEFAGST